MTVKELIDVLNTMNQDAVVCHDEEDTVNETADGDTIVGPVVYLRAWS